jgi:tellurite resistance protein TerC
MMIWLWAGFLLFIVVMLTLDLGVINRRAHVISGREAIGWTLVCIGLALAFNVLVYFMYEHHWLGIGTATVQPTGRAAALMPQSGREAAQMFFAGWVVEYSLSMDNIFVIALIFQYFRVPEQYQHRVLFWGILGALIMRGAMIGAGTALIRHFDWMEYLFGAFLIYTAVRMLLAGDEPPDPERGWVVRLARRLLPMTPAFDRDRFFGRIDGRRAMTPLFLVLLVVETTDVVFAVDSIPAILAITHDPFLVFTSNVFAILGLRSMYFALAAIIDKFRYLKVSLVFVLAFVGVKMLIGVWDIHIPTAASLVVIVLILCGGLVASALASRRQRLARPAPIDDLALAAERAWKRARRVVILVLGLTIMFIIAPLTGVIPGPGGIPVFIAGLALLATEFVWARNLLKNLKTRAQSLAASADALVIGSRPKPWLIIPVVLAWAAAAGYLLYRGHWELSLLVTLGPGLAIGYWAYATIRRWRQLRAAKRTGSPEVVAATAAENPPV